MVEEVKRSPADITWAVTRAVGYTLLALAGLSVLIYPPQSYRGADMVMTVTWGLLLLPGVVAAAGVLWRRYAVEWIALYPLVGGTSLYGFLSWRMAFTESLGALPRALMITALALFLISRICQLWQDDRRARLVVAARQEVGESGLR